MHFCGNHYNIIPQCCCLAQLVLNPKAQYNSNCISTFEEVLDSSSFPGLDVSMLTYCLFMLTLAGKIEMGVLWSPGPKMGNSFSLNLSLYVHRCLLLPVSQNDTSPFSILTFTLMVSGLLSRFSTVRGVVRALQTPLLRPMVHTPAFVVTVNFLFRTTDSLHTPKIHLGWSATRTSQRWRPEEKPSDPRTKTQGSNLSGLSGKDCLS